jgi:TrpR-related protein YerC/YecD
MYPSKLQSEQVDFLCDAIVAVGTREEAYRLLEDLCTITEVESLSQRLIVARLLRSGATYQQIVRETGASSATVSRVKRCLEYGADGYRMILAKLDEREGR